MICYHCKKETNAATFCPYCGARLLKEPLPHHLPVGTVIGGRYRIEGVLGEGGFGITYLGKNVKLGMAVAVKEYYPHGYSYRSTTGGTEVFVSQSDANDFYVHGKERFLSEAQTLVRFNAEPGVVSVIDFFEENNTAYLVMEYLEGETLQQYLKDHGKLSADEALRLLEPVMKTLEKIHASGVIHRDISPDNIMHLRSGQLKLMDFGAAREYVEESRSMSVVLKRGYAPMEQYRRNGKQGPWTDVYALCATIYRCITGTTPEDSLDRVVEDTLLPPSQRGADITPATEAALMRGLAVRQSDRCQDMTELLHLLAQAQSGDQANPQPVVPERKLPQENATVVAESRPTDPHATVYADEKDLTQKPSFRPAVPAPPPAAPKSAVSAAPMRNVVDPPAPERKEPVQKKGKKGAVIGVIAAVLAVALIVGIIVIRPWDSSNSSGRRGKTNGGGQWTNITAVSAGGTHTVGLKEDGTVIATGDNTYGQCDVGGWTDIIAVSAGNYHTVGLEKDGTVVATTITDDAYNYGQCDVGSWSDIAHISVGEYHTVGLKEDGTVVATGSNGWGQCDVDGWTDIIAISADSLHTVGLKEDGTVVATGYNSDGQLDVGGWSGIASVSTGGAHTIGLKTDGTLTATRDLQFGQCDVGGWSGIAAVSAGHFHTVGLKEDGTVVATGWDKNGECSVDGWNDIVSVSAGTFFTVGLKQDGTVVATGDNNYGQCSVSD